MVGVREKPPRVRGLGFDLVIVAAKTGDEIEADRMRVNMRAKIFFANFISELAQVFGII
jgi:hypothetical protein